MHKRSGDVERKPKEPEDQKNDCDRPKHSSIRSHAKEFLELIDPKIMVERAISEAAVSWEPSALSGGKRTW
jgi:hypothetical protein